MLSDNQAQALLAKVDQAEKALDAGNCQTVSRRAEEGIATVQEQNGVSVKLQNNVIEGFERVRARAESECEPDEPEETPTPTEEPTEAPTVEPTPEVTETPVPTEEPTEVPTEEPTPAPTEEIPNPEPTDDTGGVFAPENEDDDDR